jgi:hypothetical protein
MQEVRDRIELTAAASCRRGQVAADQDPFLVLADLKQEFEDEKNKVLGELSQEVLRDGLIFKRWFLSYSKDPIKLHKSTNFEQAKLIRERALQHARAIKFGQQINKKEIVQRAIG